MNYQNSHHSRKPSLLPTPDRYARRHLLIIRVPDDPVLELRYPRVDAGPVAVAAPDAPADDPGQLVPEVQSEC